MLSISGMPLFSGFVSKSMIKYAFKDNALNMFMYTLINIGTTASFIKFSRILFGPKYKVTYFFRDSKRVFAMMILAVLSIGIGLFFTPIVETMFDLNIRSVVSFSLDSWLDYAMYVIIGYVSYRFFIKKDGRIIQKIRQYSMSFEDANFAFIVFLSVFISIMFFFV
jgi:multicomponent Na+:H+ antiporter subunit D